MGEMIMPLVEACGHFRSQAKWPRSEIWFFICIYFRVEVKSIVILQEGLSYVVFAGLLYMYMIPITETITCCWWNRHYGIGQLCLILSMSQGPCHHIEFSRDSLLWRYFVLPRSQQTVCIICVCKFVSTQAAKARGDGAEFYFQWRTSPYLKFQERRKLGEKNKENYRKVK